MFYFWADTMSNFSNLRVPYNVPCSGYHALAGPSGDKRPCICTSIHFTGQSISRQWHLVTAKTYLVGQRKASVHGWGWEQQKTALLELSCCPVLTTSKRRPYLLSYLTFLKGLIIPQGLGEEPTTLRNTVVPTQLNSHCQPLGTCKKKKKKTSSGREVKGTHQTTEIRISESEIQKPAVSCNLLARPIVQPGFRAQLRHESARALERHHPSGDSILALSVRRGQDQIYQMLTKHRPHSKLSKSILMLTVLRYVRLQDFSQAN